ncbi:MAG: hypothetical protein ACK55Z_38075 [bacterium]
MPSIFVSHQSCDILQDTSWPLMPGADSDDGNWFVAAWATVTIVGVRDHCRSHGVLLPHVGWTGAVSLGL